ncbi:MAG: precorrin-8X methylmutase [Mastigocoleus sp.]
MATKHLTIKQLTQEVGSGLTPRMVRHYHKLGLLPQAKRSSGNYRLYTDSDVQQLRRIMALKSQGFQLEHIRELLENSPEMMSFDALACQLQQQYHSVTEQLARLRQTASALEEFIQRDKGYQDKQLKALKQLKQLEIESAFGLEELETLWNNLDTTKDLTSENFGDSLGLLLPDLSKKNEIERYLLSQLVLACGDVSLVDFVRLSKGAIATSRRVLKTKCQIVADVSPVVAAFDHTRISHLGLGVSTLIDDPHIHNVEDAEQKFLHNQELHQSLSELPPNCILVIGYTPSVLMSALKLIEAGKIQPSLIIGMPIGFNHALSAKRLLMHSGVDYITTIGTLGGGLLASVALNSLVGSLIERPDCHCYLSH